MLQVVPSIERGERINVGVVLHCRRHRFLEARIEVDRERLLALAPEIDLDAVGEHLRTIERVAAGERDCGTLGRLQQSERFGWIAAPSSTVIQASPTHTGVTGDPEATLEHLFATLVRA
ncbi:DUF3037 domain-containing protein [Thermoleophilia bacterium SCSIO 60948]|nr:DUF3037 domain-containing protein [Thermoleophilia bacterium SCSIO 60948]